METLRDSGKDEAESSHIKMSTPSLITLQPLQNGTLDTITLQICNQ